MTTESEIPSIEAFRNPILTCLRLRGGCMTKTEMVDVVASASLTAALASCWRTIGAAPSKYSLALAWKRDRWLGAAAFIAFVVWFGRSAFDAWKPGRPGEDKSLPRAGAIIVGLLLAHSIVDYPLRTEALATVFALACGLMVAKTGVRGQRARASLESASQVGLRQA